MAVPTDMCDAMGLGRKDLVLFQNAAAFISTVQVISTATTVKSTLYSLSDSVHDTLLCFFQLNHLVPNFSLSQGGRQKHPKGPTMTERRGPSEGLASVSSSIT